MFREKPSFWNFFLTRNSFSKSLLLGLGFAFGLNAFLYYFLTFGAIPFQKGFLFSVVASILLIALALLPQWRQYTELVAVFERGLEIKGTIVNMYFVRGSGYITYEYQYQQEKHRSTDSINRLQKPKEMTVGQEVILYVSRENPKQAYMRDIYLNTFQPTANR